MSRIVSHSYQTWAFREGSGQGVSKEADHTAPVKGRFWMQPSSLPKWLRALGTALVALAVAGLLAALPAQAQGGTLRIAASTIRQLDRSEEHTSELQSRE